ncbi:MAG: SRPBCC domain-containing protein [Actinomycetia bacterium]|nr:SRPBCC domain-containing protein [Actinomycetes bacterium]
MELTHDFVVPADIETTWATFMDLETVGGCFPGATVTEVSDDSFKGTVKVKLGPIALQYAGSGEFLERDDNAKRAVIEAKGKDKRGNGTAGATVTMQLAPTSDGTRVDVTTELQITGKPAQFGRGVMQDVSDKLLQQFVSCIEGQFAEAAAPVIEAEESAAEEVPTPAEVFGEAEGSDATTSEADATEAPAGVSTFDAPAPPTGTPISSPTAASRPAMSRAPARRPAPSDDDAIDLGATVLPVLVKSYAPHVVGAVVAILFGYLLGRRR